MTYAPFINTILSNIAEGKSVLPKEPHPRFPTASSPVITCITDNPPRTKDLSVYGLRKNVQQSLHNQCGGDEFTKPNGIFGRVVAIGIYGTPIIGLCPRFWSDFQPKPSRKGCVPTDYVTGKFRDSGERVWQTQVNILLIELVKKYRAAMLPREVA